MLGKELGMRSVLGLLLRMYKPIMFSIYLGASFVVEI